MREVIFIAQLNAVPDITINMPALGNLSLNCKQIKSKKGLFLLVWVFSSFFSDTSVQENINSCVLYPACCGWKEEGDIIVFCIVEIFKRITLHGLEITRRSMVPHHARSIAAPPPTKKKKTERCLLTTEGINKLVAFQYDSNVGCQQSSHQKPRHHPAPGAPCSVLFSSPRAPWQLHACAPAEVKAVTSEGTVKSLPALEDVGVLPTITQMFPISWASPRLFQRHLCER